MTIPDTSLDDAEFVIFGGRLDNGSVGYANHNGDFVALTRAETWGYQKALETARELAASIRRGVWVAPLLFGLPDVESLTWIPAGAA
ncbi:hypothetical protein [Brevundimonas diminuta]|uniref:Uncharacterized protein n=1 Tax=Brevundimonas diminuta TaxID=293 RepID=A0A410NTD9_BREDI|nr:hypothetical protein [Brevundimonas diminuta]QAT13031.1 hypothetical protein EQG53_00925 [Brevundimonas diminuta]QQB89622.1 hypothetical protein I6H83_04040 [Brevundimonas diminuta]